MVKGFYLPETKVIETKKNGLFLAMKVLGWENESLPAFEVPNRIYERLENVFPPYRQDYDA